MQCDGLYGYVCLVVVLLLHTLVYFVIVIPLVGLRCFDAVGWVAGRASGL